MKFIITEDKIHQVIFKWLNKRFDGADEIKNENNSNSILFTKNNEIIALQDLNNKWFVFDCDLIWDSLIEMFSLDEIKIYDITQCWLKEHRNLEDYVCQIAHLTFIKSLEESKKK